VMHCHNVVHEDHAMMATWNIMPDPNASAAAKTAKTAAASVKKTR